MARTIQDVRADEYPQRAYEFEVEILGSTVSGNEPILTQRVRNANIPSVENEVIEINFKSQKTIHVGRDSSPHTMTITFWDDEEHTIYSFFKNWKENGLNSVVTGGGTTRDLYAAELIIKFFATDSQTETKRHNFTKVFPTSIGEISLSYESSEHVSFDITFSYDAHTIS